MKSINLLKTITLFSLAVNVSCGDKSKTTSATQNKEKIHLTADVIDQLDFSTPNPDAPDAKNVKAQYPKPSDLNDLPAIYTLKQKKVDGKILDVYEFNLLELINKLKDTKSDKEDVDQICNSICEHIRGLEKKWNDRFVLRFFNGGNSEEEVDASLQCAKNKLSLNWNKKAKGSAKISLDKAQINEILDDSQINEALDSLINTLQTVPNQGLLFFLPDNYKNGLQPILRALVELKTLYNHFESITASEETFKAYAAENLADLNINIEARFLTPGSFALYLENGSHITLKSTPETFSIEGLFDLKEGDS